MPLMKNLSAVLALLKVKSADRFWGLIGKKEEEKNYFRTPIRLIDFKGEIRVKDGLLSQGR